MVRSHQTCLARPWGSLDAWPPVSGRYFAGLVIVGGLSAGETQLAESWAFALSPLLSLLSSLLPVSFNVSGSA